MPHTKILAHVVFATKHREPIISRELKPVLLKHIKDNARAKSINLESINCVADHMHLLVNMAPDQSIAKIVNLLKGESSFWVNKQGLIADKFEWQHEYFAISVNPKQINRVRDYIEKQEERHSDETFKREFEEFMAEYRPEPDLG